ncbi:methylated-DNA--[protein]-cysteine S-methyltransferase [Leucobacter sp. CSA1]|uniref:Methylated-DNA--protein-cysteine methyltransferase n=2 Tax=Leucobacter chromiisoli TaxID=2796471 RepID=A0A934Q7Y3_9MICO|nr:methylated-DNA--[protein]-cysteine S-methyltransferase [Leucobacter chromiisoli]MBK0418990.1 methylated-DNA--[protein]-cysteine S-methyltransferase [Leucobacter chromiisoli]
MNTEASGTGASTTRHAWTGTELGELLMVACDAGVTGLYFPSHRRMPDASGFGPRVDAASDPLLARTRAQLAEYFAGSRREFDVPLAPAGDEFSERVWLILREIPYGETTTYGAIAARLGEPRLAQRVGQAVGRNPVSIIVPCHRVVGADGSLTGYAGGLERKRRLLEIEEPPEAAASRLF